MPDEDVWSRQDGDRGVTTQPTQSLKYKRAPGDPMPCDPSFKVRVKLRDDSIRQDLAGFLKWDERGSCSIIEWELLE